MFDKIFFIVLFLNLTGLFRFLAPLLGVSIGQVSLVLLALNVLYLISKINVVIALFRRADIWAWCVVLLLWPFFTTLYAPVVDVREIGLLLYYSTLFFGTIIYLLGNGLSAMYKLLTMSLLVTIIGMPISMLSPQYFHDVAALADARAEEAGRPIGFFMQPNRLACCLALMFVGWFALWKNKKVLSEIIVIMVFFGVQLLTGSRMGVAVAVVVAGCIFIYNWPERLARGRLVLTIWFFVLFAVVGIIGARTYISVISDSIERKEGDLLDRVESIVYFRISPQGRLKDDRSLQERISAQMVYLDLIKQRPLLGYGFSSDTYYKGSGRIQLSAHSNALDTAFEYGIFYPLVFLVMIISMCWNSKRRYTESVLQTNTVTQFSAAFFLMFAYGAVVDVRVFYIVLGLVFALVNFPFLATSVNTRFSSKITKPDYVRNQAGCL